MINGTVMCRTTVHLQHTVYMEKWTQRRKYSLFLSEEISLHWTCIGAKQAKHLQIIEAFLVGPQKSDKKRLTSTAQRAKFTNMRKVSTSRAGLAFVEAPSCRLATRWPVPITKQVCAEDCKTRNAVAEMPVASLEQAIK